MKLSKTVRRVGHYGVRKDKRFPWKPTPEQSAKLKSLANRYKHARNDYVKRQREVEMTRYRNYIARLAQEANQETWVIGGESLGRTEVMELILMEISEGKTLKEVTLGRTGMPHPKTVYSWMDNHPDFKKAYEEAEIVGGHMMMDEALDEARSPQTKDDVPAAKLRYEALKDRAAKQNSKFLDKQITKHENEWLQTAPESRLREMLMARLKNLGLTIDDLQTLPAPVEAMPEEHHDSGFRPEDEDSGCLGSDSE